MKQVKVSFFSLKKNQNKQQKNQTTTTKKQPPKNLSFIQFSRISLKQEELHTFPKKVQSSH